MYLNWEIKTIKKTVYHYYKNLKKLNFYKYHFTLSRMHPQYTIN